jgi:hypothetical protein
MLQSFPQFSLHSGAVSHEDFLIAIAASRHEIAPRITLNCWVDRLVSDGFSVEDPRLPVATVAEWARVVVGEERVVVPD